MKKTNRFEKGSGCYNCRVCSRKTRSTGRGDNEIINLCEECFEIGGLENEIMDRGDAEGVNTAEIERLKRVCREKGGKL